MENSCGRVRASKLRISPKTQATVLSKACSLQGRSFPLRIVIVAKCAESKALTCSEGPILHKQ